jgi:hypothetical protein
MPREHHRQESGKNHRFTGLGNVSFMVVYELAMSVAKGNKNA